MGTDVIQQQDIVDRQREWETENAGHFGDGWWDVNRLRWLPKRRTRYSASPNGGYPGERDWGTGPNYPMYVNLRRSRFHPR
jgi:hypothetical protein